MPGNGYIRDKLDIKFLILFVMSEIDRPVGADDILDTVFVDEAMGYFDTSEAFYEMEESGHINKFPEGYMISEKGKAALDAYSDRLPPSVKRKAQQAVLKTMARLKRENSISCSTDERDPGNLVTTMRINDGKDELLRVDMLVVNRQQAALLENNFRNNPEKIYNAIINALLRDYKNE